MHGWLRSLSVPEHEERPCRIRVSTCTTGSHAPVLHLGSLDRCGSSNPVGRAPSPIRVSLECPRETRALYALVAKCKTRHRSRRGGRDVPSGSLEKVACFGRFAGVAFTKSFSMKRILWISRYFGRLSIYRETIEIFRATRWKDPNSSLRLCKIFSASSKALDALCTRFKYTGIILY